MKTYNKLLLGIASAVTLFTACSDFEDINKDPNAVSEGSVEIAHLLNKSIIGAQQNPEIAERIFVLSWKRAAHFERASGFALGADNDDYNKLYFGTSYGVGWLISVNRAIDIATKRVPEPDAVKYQNNALQMSRIWRAYLLTELSDCFGPLPTHFTFDGTAAPYESVEAIYTFVLKELKEAEALLDLTADMKKMKEKNNQSDPIFDADMAKWKKYANSLRMRCAMRLSVVAPAIAQREFEDAAKGGNFITTLDEMAQVQEKGGWTDLDGVMSRTWNSQILSPTLNNIMLGLGGVDINYPAEVKSAVKDAKDYMGLRLEQHFPLNTNDPSAGYFFDGLPKQIDPRATTMFHIPGYDDGEVYSSSIGGLATEAKLLDPADTKKTMLTLTTKFAWSTSVAGTWDKKGDLSNDLIGSAKNFPCIAKKYRESTNKRVWFGPWETYFLLAEAKLYGWNVPGTAKENYENGIRVSFEYNKVALEDYLSSTDYNRIGTSVAFDHTTEATPYTVNYVDGYTKAKMTTTYTYPKNSIYKGGQFNNDALTKIITQKFIAQHPWLPLEAWSDHRRLGLPFFENQAVEIDYNPSIMQVPLTKGTSNECRWEFYPKRMHYPSNLPLDSKKGYDQAMQLLGGADNTATPLWWEMKK